MYVESIGIQTIMPKSGTSQQQQTPPPQQQAARNDDTPAHDVKVPPAQGLGKFVNKTV